MKIIDKFKSLFKKKKEDGINKEYLESLPNVVIIYDFDEDKTKFVFAGRKCKLWK